MKKFPVVLLLVISGIKAFSQNQDFDYKLRADEISNEIWGNTIPAFGVNTIPAELNNESAIIIASSVEVVNSIKKIKFFTRFPKFSYQTTLHYRIKLNDRAALEEFSTIEYTKQLDLYYYYGFSKLFNKRNGYIGAKIIKPDGSEIVVNTSEEVLTRDEKKFKKSKLAIPGMEVGDILDYYLRFEKIQEGFTDIQGPYTFMLGGEYPILYYNLKFQLHPSAGVKYVNANGAPLLEKSSNDNEEIILELTKTNLPKFSNTFLTSEYRQSPYIRLEYRLMGETPFIYSDFKKGEVKQGFSVDNIINEYKAAIRSAPSENILHSLDLTNTWFGNTADLTTISKDSVVKVLYNAWRFNTFYFFSTADFDISHELNNRYAKSIYNAINFSKMLDNLKIANSIYFVCSRYSSNWENALNLSDFSALVKVKAAKQYWLSFDDMVTQFNEVPARFQGEFALLIAPDESGKYAVSGTNLPVTSATENAIYESIVVNPDTSNLQVLHIDRTCRQSGASRHSNQKKLLLAEDIDANLAAAYSQKKLTERIQTDIKTQKRADEFFAFFKEERNSWKTYFSDEIATHFDNEPKEVTAFEIHEPAFISEDKPFEYRSSFSMDNFVKKAGGNYIIEAGKLIGVITKVEGKERNRTLDVFRICPSLFSWNISLNIPAGYRLKGVEEMNNIVENETGSFISIATIEGTVVNIRVMVKNMHYREKAENWPKILEISDALYYFSTQKLLLEKNK